MMTGINLFQALDYADPEDLGGASRVALALSRELGGMGWNVVNFAGWTGPEGFRTCNGHTLCHFHRTPAHQRTLWSDVGSAWRPQGTLKRYPPQRTDLVVCHQPLVAWNVRRLIGRCPLVYFFHSPWPEEYQVKKRKRQRVSPLQVGARVLLERWALGRARVISIASAFMRERFSFHHGRTRFARKIVMLPYGVDTDVFRPHPERRDLRKRLGLPSRGKMLLTIRRLEDRMGLEELLKAVGLCTREGEDVFLVIVGKGSLEHELKRRAGALGLLPAVRFWGYARSEDLPLLYNAADLFVLPTQELEGFGLVILEALACGTPVVATPVGGIPEAMGRLRREYLAAGTDHRSLAERIGSVLKREPRGTDHYRDFVLENYSWRRFAERLAEHVGAVLTG